MENKKCPFCGEEILAIAKKCKHCGEWFENAVIVEQKKMVECPFCAEEIEDGLKICPLCDEPLKDNRLKTEKKTKKKKSKKKKIWGIIISVLVIIASTIFSLYIGELRSKQQESGRMLESLAETSEPISTSISDKEEQELMALLDLPPVQTLSTEFQEFLQKFTESVEMQLSLINKPLSIYTSSAETDVDEEDEEYVYTIQKTMLNSAQLKENWKFWSSEYFFTGLRKVEIGDNLNECEGVFSEKGNIIVYELRPETEYMILFIFEKINGYYCLTKYIVM